MSGSKSIGSLETWEPEDKSFTKHAFKEGSGEAKPNEGSICTVHIIPVGKCEISEEQLGGYNLGEDVEITIGEGDSKISTLFDKVVTSMLLGETCYVKSKLDAEGKKLGEFEVKEKGLKFNMSLKSFERASDLNELESDEKLERAQHHKDKGTQLYQKDNMEYAEVRYTKALSCLENLQSSTLPESLESQYRKLKCQCYLNLGACYLKTEDYNKVVENCSHSLELEPQNVKGLFRRAQAFTKLHDYDQAKKDLLQAGQLDRDNKAVINQLHQIELLVKKEKQMYQKMFTS